LRPAWKPWRTPSRTSSTRRSRPDGARNADAAEPLPPGGVITSSAWLSRFYGEPGVVGSTVKAGLRIPTDFDGIPSLVL
jgi:hypothetical protein